MEEKEINLLDYIYVLVKWRKLIIINFLVVSIITAIFSLIMPQTFRGRAVLLPPTSQVGGLSTLLSGLPIGGLGGMGTNMSDETNKFIAILHSRTMMESVINKFDLIERYKSPNIEEATKGLRENMGTAINEEGTITITANASTGFLPSEEEKDEVRKLASDMANFFVSELDRINKKLQTIKARHHREFIEQRYEQNKIDLAKSEQNFKEFQEKYDAIALPEQLQAAIKAAAEIKAEIIAADVELGALKTSFNSDHPEIRKKEVEIRELKKTLKELKYGTEKTDNSIEIFPTFTEAPDLGVKLIQLKREVEVQNKLYEFLTQQYEQAKLQEAKDTPTLQVLDKAVPPIRRIRPVRRVMVIVCAFLSVVVSIMAICILEFLERIKARPTEKKKLDKIVQEVKLKKD